MHKVGVIGSLNVDFITEVDTDPKMGETVSGKAFNFSPGGKGANQAIALSKLGADVTFLGYTGKDYLNKIALENFESANVSTDNIKEIEGVQTGVANIIVDKEGENKIIIIPGANMQIDKNYIDEKWNLIKEVDMVVLQIEIPLEINQYIINKCYDENIKTILNPAPAYQLSEDILKKVSYITPNEHEMKIIFNTSEKEALEKYPNKLIITKGEDGVVFHDAKEVIKIPANKVPVVDTIGAGDTFNAGLAISLVKNKSLKEAIEFGNLAASIAIQSKGAQTVDLSKLKEYNE